MAITRKKVADKFTYYKAKAKRPITSELEIDRINQLAIPPAWRDVEIAEAKSAKVQAKGIDAAGRVQAIYHPNFRKKQERLKFSRILRFAEVLPKLRRQVEKDLKRKRLGEQKVVACIVRLIDDQFFRVGSERYAREHNTYGVTTLRSKHAHVTTTSVTFDFVGKSGQEHVKKITDPQIARIIRQLDEMPGYEIFRYVDEKGDLHNVDSKNVNAYIKKYMGEEFSAKDFRTWGGTLLAVTALLADDIDDATTQTARAKLVRTIVKGVAKRLGNTPTVAKSSYIDPRIFEALENGVAVPKLKRSMKEMKPKCYLTVEEQCVLKLLSS